jgi:hypothetical protein
MRWSFSWAFLLIWRVFLVLKEPFLIKLYTNITSCGMKGSQVNSLIFKSNYVLYMWMLHNVFSNQRRTVILQVVFFSLTRKIM